MKLKRTLSHANDEVKWIEIQDVMIFMLIVMAFLVEKIFQRDGITRLCQYGIVCYASFYSGMLAWKYRGNRKVLVKKFVFWFSLFLARGYIYDYRNLQKRLIQSLCDMVSTVKVPRGSELFFTVAMLILCTLFLCKHVEWIEKNKKICLVISLLTFAVLFLPKEEIGYPIIGLFVGCTTYQCVPILPTFIFYLMGIYVCSEHITFSKKTAVSTGVVSVVCCGLFLTPLRPIVRYFINTFPIVLLYWISEWKISKEIQNIVCRIIMLIKRVIKKYFVCFQKSGKKYLPVYFVSYTVLFGIVAWFVFAVFRELDNAIIWIPDALSQYVPKAYYYSSYVREAIAAMLKGDFHLASYDFKLGLGNAITLSHEPLYFIFALFKPESVEVAYQVVLITRYFVAGLSASILFLYFGARYYQALFGSIMYAFCGFAISEGVRHAQFIVPMIILPIFILAAEEMIRNKRWYVCPIIVAVSLQCGYYFHYMNTLVMGIYYLIRYACLKTRTLKGFFVTTIKFSAFYILGVMIGNSTLTTTFAAFLGSGRTGGAELATESLFFYGKSWIKSCFSSFISLPDSPSFSVRFGFAAFAYIAVAILFIKKGKKELRTLFILFTMACMFPIVGSVFNGFSAVINRWIYAYALLIAGIVVYALSQIDHLTMTQLKILFLTFIPYLLFVTFERDRRSISNVFAAVILLLSYMVIFAMSKKIAFIKPRVGKASLLFLCCVSICFNAYYQYTEGSDTTDSHFLNRGECLSWVTNSPLEKVAEVEDDSFYRIGFTQPYVEDSNGSQIMGYRGITEFSSTLNGNLLRFIEKMGTATSTLVRSFGFDNRTYLNALADVKYYGNQEATNPFAVPYGYDLIDRDKEKGYLVYQNRNALPFGYTYDQVISEEELDHYKTVDRQEVLMQAATVGDDEALKNSTVSKKDNIVTSSQEVEIQDVEIVGGEISEDHIFKVSEPTATVTLKFDEIQGKELYIAWKGEFYTKRDKPNGWTSLNFQMDNHNRRHYYLLPENNTYKIVFDELLFNLGYQEEKTKECTITLEFPKEEVLEEDEFHRFLIDSFKIYAVDMEPCENYTNNLKENSLENVEMLKDEITGDITLDQDKLLVLSLPYQKGWTAYVDGKKENIVKANLMYSGIFLSKGNHSIRLVYERPGQRLSIMLSAVGIAILIMLLIIFNVRNGHANKRG